jgi:hypothetical protein
VAKGKAGLPAVLRAAAPFGNGLIVAATTQRSRKSIWLEEGSGNGLATVEAQRAVTDARLVDQEEP